MRVSHFLSAAVCAGTLALAGHLPAEEAAGGTGSVEKGKTLFEEKCAACHTGATAPTPDVLGMFSRGDFQGKMDSHAAVGGLDELTEEDRDDIYAYLQTQRDS